MSKEKVYLADERRRADFAQNAADCTPGDFTVVRNFKKDTGNWLVIEHKSTKQQILVDSGELLAIHNDAVAGVKGKSRIFEGEKLIAGTEANWLPNLKIGIKAGRLEFAA